MKISASILDCTNKINSVLELNRTNINYIHIDVMDGNFVPNTSFEDMGVIRGINLVTKYKMDVHLMVDNPIDYINNLSNMNIEFITIHQEIKKDKRKIIKRIKELGYKVGISIKPNTNINELKPYLNDIDMVLLMSVEPGMGGQSFIENTTTKIKELKNLIKETNKDILIEVDGGINNETISKIKDIDIAVVGSYITKSDNYYKQVEELIKNINLNSNSKDKNIVKLNIIEINKKKKLYTSLLIIGILPLVLSLGYALLSMIIGIDFFFKTYYGIEAFQTALIIVGFIGWPILLIALMLIIISIIKLNKLSKQV